MEGHFFNLFIFEETAFQATFLAWEPLVAALTDPSSVIVTAAERELPLDVKTGPSPKWKFYTTLSETNAPYLVDEQATRLGDTLNRSPGFQNSKEYIQICPSDDAPIELILEDRRQIFAVFNMSPPSISTSSASSIISNEPYDRDTITQAALKRQPPSIAAKVSNLINHQNPNTPDAMYNSRPYYTLSPSPILLYHPVFTQFSREFSSPPQWDTEEERIHYLNWAAKFQSKALAYYSNKNERRRAISFLHQLLGHRGTVLDQKTFYLDDLQEVVPDGFVEGWDQSMDHRFVSLLTGLENELGEVGYDPSLKGECVYMKIVSNSEYEPFRATTCCPVFLLSICGPYISLSGCIFVERFMSERLSDMLYVGPMASRSSGQTILRIAHFFHCLARCLDTLERYHAELITPGPSVSSHSEAWNSEQSLESRHSSNHDQHIYPFITEFLVDGNQVKLRYKGRFHPSRFDLPTFKAEFNYKNEIHRVIVKFVSTYPKRVHQLLEDRKLAPKLWYCEELDIIDGLTVVVMDRPKRVEINPENKTRVFKTIKDGVNILHQENLVHGNLTKSNIVPTKDGVMLLEFDWAGEEGVARYPLNLNTMGEISWHHEVGPMRKILKVHDKHMLEEWISSLEADF